MKGIAAVIALCLVCSWSAVAQVPDPVGISTGTRVRVSLDGGPPVIGSIVQLTPKTLDLADSRSTVLRLNTPSVTSLEISRGRPVHGNRLAKGAFKGFLILGGAATVAILASDPGYAFVGPLVFGPPGALIGALHANVTRPEVWEAVPVTALASVAQGGVSLANSADGSTQPARAVKRGRGRQIAIGAALGIAAGAAYASSNKSATPTGTKMVMFAIPAGLLGAAVGAFIP